jgi:hypothetical protein
VPEKGTRRIWSKRTAFGSVGEFDSRVYRVFITLLITIASAYPVRNPKRVSAGIMSGAESSAKGICGGSKTHGLTGNKLWVIASGSGFVSLSFAIVV